MKVTLSSFYIASSAGSQVASDWTQIVKMVKVKRSRETVIKTTNMFKRLGEEMTSEVGVGAGGGQAEELRL